MNEVLIAISGGEGGLRALERPTRLLNHPGVRVGCWGGSAPQHDPCGAAGTHTSGWERNPPSAGAPALVLPSRECGMRSGRAHPLCRDGRG